MKKVLIAVMFLLVLFIVAVEVNKRLRVGGEGVLPEAPRFSEVKNAPEGIHFHLSLVIQELPEGKKFVMGVVRKIQGRTLTLELWNSTIEVDIDKDATYRIAYVNYDISQPVEGDHFDEIFVNDLIGLMIQIDQKGNITAYTVILLKKE